jgi:transcriptional regulator
MYAPAHFKEDRIPVLHDAIRQAGFGSLITFGVEGLEASHIPMLIDPEPAPFGTLHGHVARANPQWRRATAGAQALALFLGPNTYITPSWYASKRETGKVVPTWNYVAIHAYGPVSFFDDPSHLRDHIAKLTETHEASRPEPWAVTDAPAQFVDAMLKGIVSFKLVIARLEGKWKMSQNRSADDVARVREGLVREGGDAQRAVAGIMAGIAGK